MRRTIHVALMAIAVLFYLPAVGQSKKECKVLMPEISQQYDGKCKNGFAHGKGKAVGRDKYEGKFEYGLPNGKGTYTWSSGEMYKGEWVNGKREGLGDYFYTQDGRRVVTSGLWIDNTYVGPAPERPKVVQSLGVERYNFQRQGDGNTIMVNLYLNGSNNIDILNFVANPSSGSQYSTGGTVGFEGVVFPFICKLTYLSWNKLHSSRVRTSFEFTISQPGRWQVVVHNN